MKCCMVQGNDENTYERETSVLRKERLVNLRQQKKDKFRFAKWERKTPNTQQRILLPKKQKEE